MSTVARSPQELFNVLVRPNADFELGSLEDNSPRTPAHSQPAKPQPAKPSLHGAYSRAWC